MCDRVASQRELTSPIMHKSTFQWNVPDFDRLKSKFECAISKCDSSGSIQTVNEVVESSIFSSNDNNRLKWCLVLFCRRNKDGNQLCFEFRSRDNRFFTVDVKLCISIFKNNEQVLRKKSDFCIKRCADLASTTSGFILDFLSITDLFDERCGYLSNGELQILCNFFLSDDKEDQISKLADSDVINRSILSKIEKLWKDNKICDTELTTACGRKLFANKYILSEGSPVFCKMLKNNFSDEQKSSIKINDVRYDILKEVLLFMHSGKIEKLDHGTVGSLMAVAIKYEISDLNMACKKFLLNNNSDCESKNEISQPKNTPKIDLSQANTSNIRNEFDKISLKTSCDKNEKSDEQKIETDKSKNTSKISFSIPKAKTLSRVNWLDDKNTTPNRLKVDNQKSEDTSKKSFFKAPAKISKPYVDLAMTDWNVDKNTTPHRLKIDNQKSEDTSKKSFSNVGSSNWQCKDDNNMPPRSSKIESRKSEIYSRRRFSTAQAKPMKPCVELGLSDWQWDVDKNSTSATRKIETDEFWESIERISFPAQENTPKLCNGYGTANSQSRYQNATHNSRKIEAEKFKDTSKINSSVSQAKTSNLCNGYGTSNSQSHYQNATHNSRKIEAEKFKDTSKINSSESQAKTSNLCNGLSATNSQSPNKNVIPDNTKVETQSGKNEEAKTSKSYNSSSSQSYNKKLSPNRTENETEKPEDFPTIDPHMSQQEVYDRWIEWIEDVYSTVRS